MWEPYGSLTEILKYLGDFIFCLIYLFLFVLLEDP